MGSEGEILLWLDGVIRMHGSEEESETWMQVYLMVAITLGKTLPWRIEEWKPAINGGFREGNW
jgi:hypothetical protein